MAQVLDVARFFLSLSQPDEGDYLSHLKLQKLCYYAQGFHLALFDRPLFRERIEAWEHGPVVVELYRLYKDFGSAALPVPTDVDAKALSEPEQELLREVWNTHGQFSAWKLRSMTHDEPPWADTPRNHQISHEVMRAYFKTQLK